MATNEDKELPPVLRAVRQLENFTVFQTDAKSWVRRAFLLGLWYKQFPDYVVEHLDSAFNYDIKDIDPLNSGWNYDTVYPNLMKFQFISDTGDSWHQCYRDFRRLGWERIKVHRNGGRLKYLLRNTKGGMPEGYSSINLLLDISIATCKQVQVGTKMVEQPIFETKCDDLVDLNDVDADPPVAYAEAFIKEGSCDCSVDCDRTSQGGPDVGIHTPDCASVKESAEVTQLVVIDDIEELQRRRSERDAYEAEHGPEGQIPRKSEFEDDIPF